MDEIKEQSSTFEDLCFFEASFVPGGFLAPELYEPPVPPVGTGSSIAFSLEGSIVPEGMSPLAVTPT